MYFCRRKKIELIINFLKYKYYVKSKIEPGTQPGKQIRLRGKGMPAIKGYGYGRGDIIVNITVFIPTSLTKEEKDLVVKFKECDNFKADNAEKKSLFESFKNLFKK